MKTNARAPMDREMTLPMAAMRLGVSGEIARRRLLEGRLKGRLQRGRWMITEESVLRLLREQCEPIPA